MTPDLRLIPALAGAWATGALTLLAGPGWGIGATLLIGLCAIFVSSERRMPLVLAALAALALTASASAQSAARSAGLSEGTVTVIGRVSEDGRATALDSGFPARAIVAGEAVITDGRATPTAARLVVLGDVAHLRRDDHVSVTGRVILLPPGSATALFIISQPPLRAPDPGLLGMLAEARANFRLLTDTLSPHGRGLVPGLATGDDSALPDVLAEAMRTASLTHLTAVSGSHVALVAGMVMMAASRVPRRARAVVVLLALGLLVGLVGPEASVLRATAMGCVAAVALARGRPPSAVPALAGGGTLLLVLDPWLALSLGFALSAAATAALILLAPALVAAWAPGGGRRAVGAALLAIPLSAQLACAPLLLLVGADVSVYGVVANLVVLPAVAPVTVLGLAGVATVSWWPALALLCARAADFFSGWIAWVALTASHLPGAILPWPDGLGGVLLLAALHVGIAALLLRPQIWRRAAVAALTIALLAGIFWPRPGPWDVLLCDVGQGHALLIRTGPASAILVDTGPPDGGVDQCLRGAGVRAIELLVITHAHADHVGGLSEVLATVPVFRVLSGPGPAPWVDEQLGSLGLTREVALAGHRGSAGEIPFEVIWPLRDLGKGSDPRVEDQQANDDSLVVVFSTRGGDVLALGDLGASAQASLARRLQPAQPAAVVVMAHHGSKDQDPGLAALLSPQITLIGVGENDYGHPTEEALALYSEHSGLIARTDTQGDLRVTFPRVGRGMLGTCQSPGTKSRSPRSSSCGERRACLRIARSLASWPQRARQIRRWRSPASMRRPTRAGNSPW